MGISKEKFNRALDALSVLWIILSTGSLVFCIFNMKFSMFVLLGIAAVYIMQKSKMGGKQFRALGIILLLVVLNSLINIRYLSLNDDIIILLIRLFSIAVICTNITRDQFKLTFCKILYVLCILSLICFVASEAGLTLPGQTTVWFKNKYYIYTVYHTLGRWSIFHRNAGVFWESPAFAIFINTALAFLMLGGVNVPSKTKIRYFVVYSITLFSTLAITAYIEFFLILMAILFQRRSDIKEQNGNNAKSTRYLIGIAVIAVLVVFLIRESNTHMIMNKILNQQGSYWERSNDTLQAIQLGIKRPFIGYGLFNSFTSDALNSVKVTDNSNSFSSLFMYLGFPLFIIYVLRFVWGVRSFVKCSLISTLLVIGSFIVFLNSEQIALMTLFLVFLFPFKGDGDDLKFNRPAYLHRSRQANAE